MAISTEAAIFLFLSNLAQNQVMDFDLIHHTTFDLIHHTAFIRLINFHYLLLCIRFNYNFIN